MATPGVSFLTLSRLLASSFGFASSLAGSFPPPEAEELCACVGIALWERVAQASRNITMNPGKKPNRGSRFTAPSLIPDLPERPRGRTKVDFNHCCFVKQEQLLNVFQKNCQSFVNQGSLRSKSL
jgi:hypothetical protein